MLNFGIAFLLWFCSTITYLFSRDMGLSNVRRKRYFVCSMTLSVAEVLFIITWALISGYTYLILLPLFVAHLILFLLLIEVYRRNGFKTGVFDWSGFSRS